MIDQLSSCQNFIIPVYHYDIINTPVLEGETLTIDTNCDLICALPRSICEAVLKENPPFRAREFLQLLQAKRSLRLLVPEYFGLRFHQPGHSCQHPIESHLCVFMKRRPHIVVGNPPWVNWEYLSPRYRAGSQHLWGEYGLLQVKGPRLGFSKEDVSTLFTCAALDRFLVPSGHLSFILRQATFRSAQNGAGFRRFHLDGPRSGFSGAGGGGPWPHPAL